MSLQLTHTQLIMSQKANISMFSRSAQSQGPRVPGFEGLGGHHSLGYQQLPNLRPAASDHGAPCELGQVFVFGQCPTWSPKKRIRTFILGPLSRYLLQANAPVFFKEIVLTNRTTQQIQPQRCLAQTCLDVKEKPQCVNLLLQGCKEIDADPHWDHHLATTNQPTSDS